MGHVCMILATILLKMVDLFTQGSTFHALQHLRDEVWFNCHVHAYSGIPFFQVPHKCTCFPFYLFRYAFTWSQLGNGSFGSHTRTDQEIPCKLGFSIHVPV